MLLISIDVGTKNLAFCTLKKTDDMTIEIMNWTVCEIPCLPTDIPKVVAYLRTILPTNDVTDIVIEKQPSRNVKMRLMENTLATYFVMLNVPKVVSYSAKYKLGNIGKTVKGKTNYTLRKKMSVAMCRAYIYEYSPNMLEMFDGSKKKDDLADCLLQGLSYVGYDINLLSEKSILTF